MLHEDALKVAVERLGGASEQRSEQRSHSTAGRSGAQQNLRVGACNGVIRVASHVLGPIAKVFSFEAAFVVGAVVAWLGVFTLGGPEPSQLPRDIRVD